MKLLPAEHISRTEFARRMGCDESTVRRYMREGKICAPAVTYRPNGKFAYLCFERAKAQYLEARAITEFRFARSGGAATGPIPKLDVLPQSRPPSEESFMPSENELAGMTLSELTKREVVLRVGLKQLELDEKTGVLVKREDVYAALFTIGQELRNRIEAIADRVIDDIIAAPTRSEAYIILKQEINSALLQVSQLGNTQFGSGSRRRG